ncbi:MAG TPA: LysE family transporter [Firmicutes bacterium]|nr:LysE family transporter [Bacillota bacterium]
MLASTFLISLSGAMAPGPLLTVAIAAAPRHGWRAGLRVAFGHGVVEAVLVLAVACGFHHFLARPPVSSAIGIVGGAFLVFLGLSQWRTLPGMGELLPAAEPAPGATGGKMIRSIRYPFLGGVLATLANPYWVIWWATVGSTLMARTVGTLARAGMPGADIPGLAWLATFFTAHVLADFACLTAAAGVAAAGGRWLGGSVYRWMLGGTAVALVIFGLVFLHSGVRYWL